MICLGFKCMLLVERIDFMLKELRHLWIFRGPRDIEKLCAYVNLRE